MAKNDKKDKIKKQNPVLHYLAGGTGGLVSTVITCPLDVIKTRLQSSGKDLSTRVAYNVKPPTALLTPQDVLPLIGRPAIHSNSSCMVPRSIIHTEALQLPEMKIASVLRNAIVQEGYRALWKGLSVSLIGMIPSRAITLGTHDTVKNLLKDRSPAFRERKLLTAVVASATAGFAQHSLTNPIWYVRTLLQLNRQLDSYKLRNSCCCNHFDSSSSNRTGHTLTAAAVVRSIYARAGIRGFWRGVSASYLGIPEVVIMLVTYDTLKEQLTGTNNFLLPDGVTLSPPIATLAASGVAKVLSSSAAYPHEVFRTRLREGSSRYRSLGQTIRLVWREEGARGFYRGFNAHLLRQFPCTVITFVVYEKVVALSQR